MIPTFEPAPALTPCPRRGFTLMELLVVIGILALLFALVMPALNMVRRQADATRTSALLASIGTALDAYKSDFGDIPRFSRDRSEEHTSELQSQSNLVCRLLLEKK